MFTIKWNITNRCTLKCIHCSNSQLISDKDDEKQTSLIFKKLKQLPISVLHLMGGEPFLSPSISEIIEAFTTKGCKVIVNTSGYQLSWKKIEPYLSNPLVCLLFSIDGFTEEVNDQIRGVGTFNHVKNLLEDIKEKGVHRKCEIGINFTLTKKILYQITPLINYKNILPSDYLIINDLWEIGRARKERIGLAIKPEEKLDFYSRLARKLKDLQKPEIYFKISPLMNKLMTYKFQFKTQSFMTCNAGGSLIFLEANGDLYPCIKYRLGKRPLPEEIREGKNNLVKNSFENIYFGHIFRSFRKKIVGKGYCQKLCYDCEFLNECVPCPYAIKLHQKECQLVKNELKYYDKYFY